MTMPADGLPEVEQGSRLHQALALEELVRANAESNSTMIRLVDQVRQDAEVKAKKVDVLEKQQRQSTKLLYMVGVLLLFMIVLGFINATNIAQARKNAAATADIARNTGATSSLLLDCLNARGECGKLNAAQQQRVLDEVKKYELTGFYCIRNNPAAVDKNAEQFLACMKRLYPTGPTLNGR